MQDLKDAMKENNVILSLPKVGGIDAQQAAGCTTGGCTSEAIGTCSITCFTNVTGGPCWLETCVGQVCNDDACTNNACQNQSGSLCISSANDTKTCKYYTCTVTACTKEACSSSVGGIDPDLMVCGVATCSLNPCSSKVY